jgi:tetratricopeptide (TPR) repeat protein
MIRSAQTIGDPMRTKALFERARNFVEKTNQKDSMEAFSIYHNLAVLHLQFNNQENYKEAEGLLEHALAILASHGHQATSDYANELAQLAANVNANGQPDRAEGLYRESLRIYERAEGGDPSVSSDFLTDAGEFFFHRRHFVDAVAAFKRAQELRQSIVDLSVEKRANTLSNLATAYFENGDLAEAIRWYRQAVDTRHQSIRQATKLRFDPRSNHQDGLSGSEAPVVVV